MTQERTRTKFSDLFDAINTLENVIAGLSLTGILIVVIIQIVGRTVGTPMPWTEEGTRYLFLWMMWVALASGFSKVESPRVTFFVSLFPQIFRKLCSCIYIAVNFFIFGFILYYGGQIFFMQMRMNEMGAAILIPMSVIGICLPVAGILGMLGVVQSVLEYRSKVDIEGRGEGK